jgi:hypothetical protein
MGKRRKYFVLVWSEDDQEFVVSSSHANEEYAMVNYEIQSRKGIRVQIRYNGKIVKDTENGVVT